MDKLENRPITTLFMLSSLDGKISTGSYSTLDFDKDLPLIDNIKDGLHQYYEIEKTTDLWSLCSGKTLSKIGINELELYQKTDVSFVIIDNNNLTPTGIHNLSVKSKELVIVTTNHSHPAMKSHDKNLSVILQPELNLKLLLSNLYYNFNCKNLTIQSGGTLNSLFIREKLIDYLDIIVAPILIGGKDTPTLIDGDSITNQSELFKLATLKLDRITQLENSYIRLQYSIQS